MNYKMIGRIIAQILLVEWVFMIPALLLSIYDGQYVAMKGFGIAIVITGLVDLLLYVLSRNSEKKLYAREGLVCVGLSWIIMGLFGALPFWISREIPSYIDSFFEIVSGFTTTGASILTDVEALSRGMLYWRSFSHWLGGMGVLVFLLAIAPKSDQGGGFTMHLLRAESPGPNVGKLVPKMKQTAMILYVIYIILTVLDFLFLIAGGMPLFDSICTAFGTAGTGGFGIRNDSIAGYSPYIQNVCTVFMLLFGVNFGCYYLLLLKQFKAVFKDEELRMYLGLVVVSVVVITLDVRHMYGSLSETIRNVAFSVSSIITTTGFATTDFDLWPSLSKTILLTLMMFGACAGSTGGGFKCGRALLIMKNLHRNMRMIINPKRVEVVRNNNQMVDEKVLQNTNTYLAAYVMIIIVSIFVLSFDGLSMETNISAIISCVNNIGPGFDAVGPTCNYHMFNPISKLVLVADMLAGRLEIFPMLVLLSRSTWRRK